MEDDVRKLLEENLRLSKENNNLLHKLNKMQRRAAIFKLIYWLFIIGVAIGAFYFIQPYIDSLKGAYSGYSNILGGFNSGSDTKSFEEFFNQINGTQQQ